MSARANPLQIVRGASEAEPMRLRSLAEVLANPGALAPPRVIIPRIAWAGRVTLLAGREKLAGKSTLAAAGVAAATCGRSFLGELSGLVTAVWWSADREAEADVARRLVRFDANPDAVYLPPYAATLDDVMLAARGIGEPVLLVVDTLTAATVGLVRDANSASEWTPVLLPLVALARETDTAVILNHHANRATGEYRDSTNIGALVDMVCELEAVTGDPAVRVVRSRGRWPTDPTFRVRLGDGPDGADYTLDGNRPALDAEVLAYVTRHPGCSTKAVRQGVDARDADIIAALFRLAGSGIVIDRGNDQSHEWTLKGGVPGVPTSAGTPPARCVPGNPRTPVGGGVSGTPAVLTSDLRREHLDTGNPPTAPTCGHPAADWWADATGNTVCGVCHPCPRATVSGGHGGEPGAGRTDA